MIWKKPEKDYWRWRKTFALLPTRVGDELIWLEHYEWSYIYDMPSFLIAVRKLK